ncbi:MAG: DUF1924 domain-containing protein [Leptothrix sp. (in: b-proteobacteria)]
MTVLTRFRRHARTATRRLATVTLGLAGALLVAATATPAQAATTPAAQMKAYAEAASSTPDAARGKAFFNTKHGAEWSCSSCHTANPAHDGQHAVTAKRIAPMAPAANPQRFSDEAKTEKWFTRNCKDVVGRACTPAEKADVIAYLASVQP